MFLRTLPLLIAVLATSISSASALPYMPSFGQPSSQAISSVPTPAAPQMPNLYKVAPVPPLIALLLQNPAEFSITAPQKIALDKLVNGNQRWMNGVMEKNRELHEDILNGITGKPLEDAEKAVDETQSSMLTRSVDVDTQIHKILTKAQWNKLISAYRGLESNPAEMVQ